MPAITTSRLTKRRIDAMTSGETLWDSDVRGFCCRARTVRKIFYLKVRVRGRQRWITIGEFGAPWTVETARLEAQRLLGEIRNGVDVEALRRGGSSQDPTIKELSQRFLDEHARHHKKASSVYTDRLNINNHILPLVGHLAVKDMTRSDIEMLKKAVCDGLTRSKPSRGAKKVRFGPNAKGGPGAANRCVAILSKMFNLAEFWGWRPENSNPCRLVSKYPENPRQRFLSEDEFQRLGEVLSTAENDGLESPYAIAAIRLLLLTGARLSEILTLRWKWVDLERGFLMLPDSKTGQKAIFLNNAAKDILKDLPRMSGNPFVIAGSKPGERLINLQRPWKRIRERASLSDVRIHDLRHSFASVAASNGASLPLIGQLLGHTQPRTTQRYAHLTAKPVQELNETVGGKLSMLLQRKRSTSS